VPLEVKTEAEGVDEKLLLYIDCMLISAFVVKYNTSGGWAVVFCYAINVVINSIVFSAIDRAEQAIAKNSMCRADGYAC